MIARHALLGSAVLLTWGCSLVLPAAPDGASAPGDGRGGAETLPGDDVLPGTDTAPRPDVSPPRELPGRDADLPDAAGDSGTDPPEPPAWDCAVAMDLLAEGVETGSFTRFGQQAVDNWVYVFYSLCGVDLPVSGPERGWFLQVDQVASLEIQVACEGPCYAYLMKDGCYYQNTQACWRPQDVDAFHAEALPGTWYVAVEQMAEEGVPAPAGWVGPPFAIHAALNRVHGHPGCQEDLVLRLSEALGEGDCVLSRGATWRRVSRAGSLPPPGEAPDRAWLPCLAGGVPLDPLGGMPEAIVRLDADLAPGDMRRVDAVAVLDPDTVGPTASWQGLLGLAAPPCGETAALAECDGGPKKELRLEDVSLLAGQEAFLYLDAAGSAALDGPIPRPWRLDLYVEDACVP